MINNIIITFVALLLILVSCITLYVVDAKKNRGFTFGYYGDFNAIVRTLDEMPDIEVLKAGGNHDVSLEEISIKIRLDGTEEIQLVFGQNEEFRKYRGEKLSTELRARIDKVKFSKAIDTTAANSRLIHRKTSKSTNTDKVAMIDVGVASH